MTFKQKPVNTHTRPKMMEMANNKKIVNTYTFAQNAFQTNTYEHTHTTKYDGNDKHQKDCEHIHIHTT